MFHRNAARGKTLQGTSVLSDQVLSFFKELSDADDFRGEIGSSATQRVVHSLDNSIYEVVPQGVIFPRSREDLSSVLRMISEPRFRGISITAKGGGTSTNGQSLNSSIIVDTSRYMNQILSLDLNKGEVRVQSGVVLDTLQRYLRPHGYSFAPTTSSSSRVTLGGMIGTDAAGIGSRVHGKTSHHLISVEMILYGGEAEEMGSVALQNSAHNTAKDEDNPSPDSELSALAPRSHRHHTLVSLCSNYSDRLREHLPNLPRGFSGYNLTDLVDDKNLHLSRLIAGSEGSLGVVSEATLRITPIMRAEAVIIIYFDDLLSCVRFGPWTLEHRGVQAVELLDHQLINAAKEAWLWPEHWHQGHAHHLEHEGSINDVEAEHKAKKSLSATNTTSVNRPLKGHGKSCQLIQICAPSTSELETYLREFTTDLERLKDSPDHHQIIGHMVGRTSEEIRQLWDIRKKSVPLFAGAKRDRQPFLKSSAFVEDVAVHPQHLPEFIDEFREILNRHGLTYAMYGHLDAGCLHVRPKLDYRDPNLITQIKKISDEVFELTRRYGGVLWGEHGKGFRSAYLADFLGPQLHEVFQRIKTLYDPHNQLNPGKICTPLGHDASMPNIDEVPLRAHKDQRIHPQLRNTFAPALACDGNGLCFKEDPSDVMCPSYRATADRAHSPKGRAALVRALISAGSSGGQSSRLIKDHDAAFININRPTWLLSQGFHWTVEGARMFIGWLGRPIFGTEWLKKQDFSHEVYKALEGCLSCGACTTSCPLGVDIPEIKSRFLALYHLRYPRKLRDFAIGWSEQLLPMVAHSGFLRMLYTWSLKTPMVRRLIEYSSQMRELPLIPAPATRPPTSGVVASQINCSALAKVTSSTRGVVSHHDDQARTGQVLARAWLMRDLFSDTFEPSLGLEILEVLRGEGNIGEGSIEVDFARGPVASGKSWALRGGLQASEKIIKKRARMMVQSAREDDVFVGIDPAFAFFFISEYPALEPTLEGRLLTLVDYMLSLPDHYFKRLAERLSTPKRKTPQGIRTGTESVVKHPRLVLFEHCQESAHGRDYGALWVEVFSKLGVQLEREKVGCCGLAGFWGHQREHTDISKRIFDLHWRPSLDQVRELGKQDDAVQSIVALVTGGSCRAQIKRFYPKLPYPVMHPVSWIYHQITSI